MTALIEVVQVGAGTVFRERYVPAVFALLPDIEIRFSDVIDILPESEIRRSLDPLRLWNFRYHRLRSAAPEALGDVLGDAALAGKPVMLATPGPAHSHQIIVALDSGRFVAVEKPLGTSRQDLKLLEQRLLLGNARDLFIFSYYVIEKGLPLTVLARSGRVTPVQLSTLAAPPPSHWADLRQRLGEVRSIHGVLVEGADDRTWVRAEDSGGQTLETFSHLAALCCVWCERLEVLDVSLGRAIGIPSAAETLTWSRLVGDGKIEIELLCAKWASAEACQRWFTVLFEHGYARMDFEREVLVVACNSREFRYRLRRSAKYEPQFRQFVEKLSDPTLPVEYSVSWRAADLALRVRDAGLRIDVAGYDEDLAPFSIPRDTTGSF